MEKHSRLLYALLEFDFKDGIDYKIAQELLKLINKGIETTIKNLSFNSYVSNATIIRFCKRLNLSGFKELKSLFLLEIGNKISCNQLSNNKFDINSRLNIAAKITKEIEAVNKQEINRLYSLHPISYPKVHILTTSNYFIYAKILEDILIQKGTYVSLYNEPREWKNSIKVPADYVIGISMSGDRIELVDIFNNHKNQNNKSKYIFISSINSIDRSNNTFFLKMQVINKKYEKPDFITRQALYFVFDILDLIFTPNRKN